MSNTVSGDVYSCYSSKSNQQKSQTVVYAVTAVNGSGNESTQAVVTVN